MYFAKKEKPGKLIWLSGLKILLIMNQSDMKSDELHFWARIIMHMEAMHIISIIMLLFAEAKRIMPTRPFLV